MPIRDRVKLIIAAAVVLALPFAPHDDAQAESALEFMLRGGAAQFGSHGRPSRYVPYTRNPERVERLAPPKTVAAPRSRGFQRVICERICDGRRFVMAIRPESDERAADRAMCRAAGAGTETRLSTERFVSGAGMHQVSAQIGHGRAAAGAPCPEGIAGSTLGVPILHDATLRRGDVVAMSDGFRVFRGNHEHLPHSPEDFVAIDPKRIASGDLEHLKIATVP